MREIVRGKKLATGGFFFFEENRGREDRGREREREKVKTVEVEKLKSGSIWVYYRYVKRNSILSVVACKDKYS